MVIPRVVRDHNSKTAILFKEGRKFVHYIPMKAGKLTVKRLPLARFYSMYEDASIDAVKAAQAYLNHSGGVTEAVRTALEEIVNATDND